MTRHQHKRAHLNAPFFRSHRSAATVAVAVVVLVSALSATLALGGTTSPHRPVVALETSSIGHGRALSPAVSSSDPTTTTTTVAPPQNPTLPAPSGFAQQLISLYDEIHTAATTVQVPGETDQLESTTDFDQQVDGLSQASLSTIYTATADTPGFSQLPGTFKQADTVAAEAVRLYHLKRRQHAGTRGATGDEAPEAGAAKSIAHRMESRMERSLIAPSALTNFNPTVPVVLYGQPSCPDGAPGINYGETSIFALQVAADIAAVAVEVIPGGLSIAFGNATIPDIARIIVAAIQLGVLITHDTFAYLQAVSNDCNATFLANLAANTDNSAYQTYQQLTGVAGTANEIDTNLANLINQDTSQFRQQLTLSIQQALSAATGTVPMAAMELPSSLGGYLDSSPVGVAEVVTNAIQAMQTAGQPMNPQAKTDETLGEEAFAAGQYKQAFDYYRLAYSAAAA